MERLFRRVEGLPAYKADLSQITRESNEVLLRVVEDLSYVYTDRRNFSWTPENVEEARNAFLSELLAARDHFVARNQEALLRALGREPAHPPDELVEA